jgi:hypothetical protein
MSDGVEIKLNFGENKVNGTGLFFCKKCEAIFEGKQSADFCCTRDGPRGIPLGNMSQSVHDFKKILQKVGRA